MSAGARRLRAGWAAVTGSGGAAAVGLAVLVACCAFLATVAPRESLGLRTEALQRELSAAAPLQRYVIGSVNYSGYASGFLGTAPGASEFAATRAALAAGLRRDGLPLAASGGWTELATGLAPVTGLAPAVSPGPNLRNPQMKVLYRDNLTRYARLVAGRLPGAGPAPGAPAPTGSLLQVAVTSATAARFGLQPGSVIGIGPAADLVVTGILRPLFPRAPFWAAQPLAAAPVLANKSANEPPYWTGGAFVTSGELGLVPSVFSPADMELSWSFPLALDSLTAAQASSLNGALIQAQTEPVLPPGAPGFFYGGSEPVTISSGIADVLGAFVQQDGAAGQVLDMMSVSLAIVGAVVVLLGSYLVAERRRREFAALRARGASSGELALRALRTAAAMVLPAALVAGALAVTLTPGPSEPLGWLLPALTVGVALASLPVITMWQHRRLNPAAAAEPARRWSPAPRLAAEVALVAAAAGGLAVLAQGGESSAGGVPVYPSMAPVLVAVPAAILVMRLYPPALRAVRRVATNRHGVAAFVGFTRAATAPVGTVLPVFALVLALSVVAFGATVRSAVSSGQTATSWQRTGADAIIDASISPRPLDAAARRAIEAVPGVQRTAAIIVLAGSAGGEALTVAAVDPSEYAALVAATPEPAFPAAGLAHPARGSPVPVLTSPAAAPLLGHGSELGIGTRQVAVRTVGTVSRVPGVADSSLVVIPRWALGANPPAPSILLAVGPQLDGARLQAVVRRELPGAAVTLRSNVLASLAAAPVARGASVAIALGTAAAAVLSALIILVAVLLSAPARDAALARLRVLGLARRRADRLVVAEVMPQIVAGAAGGVACAVAMAPLLSPGLDLSVFTGEPSAAALPPQPLLLVVMAAGLLVLGMLMLGVEIAARRRGGIAAGEYEA